MKHIIGIMGPGKGASELYCRLAFELGGMIAAQGWIVLTGGRNCGVMEAASRGAKENGGLTIGILPGTDTSAMSAYVDIPIITGINEARNMINVLSSHILVVCGINPGTASEIALAIKVKKPIILLAPEEITVQFFSQLTNTCLHRTDTVDQTIGLIQQLLKK